MTGVSATRSETAPKSAARQPVLLRPLVVIGVITAISLAFGWNQNHSDIVGGPISTVKVLWLNMTLLAFLAVPAIWLKWAVNMSPACRLVMLLAFTGYFVRGLVELPVMYMTHWWKVEYGMGMDMTMAGLVVSMLVIHWRGLVRSDVHAVLILLLYCATCLTEASFAHLFSQLADSQTGTYFASTEPKFDTINRITFWVDVVLYSSLAVLMWVSRREFAVGGTRR